MNIFMGVDIGSNYIKGILIDENNKIIAKTFQKIENDYLKTYKIVTDTLKKKLNYDDKVINLCFTGTKKRLLNKVMLGSTFKSDVRGIVSFTRKNYPSIKTIMDIGNCLKIINILDSNVINYAIDDFNIYGSFIDKVISKLDIDINKDIDIMKKKVFFKKENAYLFDDKIIDSLINKYDKEEIILGIYMMVIENIKDNIRKTKCNREILITGGLTLNKTFIRLLKSQLNRKVFISDTNIYTSVIGSIYLVKEEDVVTN